MGGEESRQGSRRQKEVHTHALRHSYATHLLEDGMDIMTLKDLLGHQKTETTREYLQIAQLESKQKFSSPDTLFTKCPCCKTGDLHRIAVFDQRGPPACFLGGSQNSIACKN